MKSDQTTSLQRFRPKLNSPEFTYSIGHLVKNSYTSNASINNCDSIPYSKRSFKVDSKFRRVNDRVKYTTRNNDV